MPDLQKFIGINFCYLRDEKRIFQSSINGSRSLLDFESVIINPESFFQTYKPEGTYKDQHKLGWDDSRRISEDYAKIKQWLIDLLVQGKDVFVMTGYTNGCYRCSGKTDVMGHPLLGWFDLYSFLPIRISLEPMRGNHFTVTDSIFKDFYASVNDLLEYHSVIEVENGNPFFKITGFDKVVGTRVPYMDGNIIFLPSVNHHFGEYGKDGDSARKRIFDAIYDLEESLHKKEMVVEYPEWIDSYNILTESTDIEHLKDLENEKQRLLLQIDSQNSRLEMLKNYKSVFTSTGEQLECVVQDLLKEMNFQICPTEKGRTDVIAKYGDIDIVVEIKGLTKSAAEKNAAQLEKWTSNFLEQNGCSAKPLLIVNAFRELPLEQRTECSFPNQMIKYSENRNHCLLTTIQLLCLFIEVSENPECKEERIRELLSTVGVYNRYSDYTNYIKKVK